jgi:acyl transferase domain-containing protein
MTTPQNSAATDGIAIIGMSGRFPGARSLTEFWDNLKNGVESITFFPDDQHSNSPSGPFSSTQDPKFVNAAGVLDDIELFDAAFFGFNPVEAATLDPQQRLLLECAWHAMEDAGYDPETFPGPIGVYAGCAMSTYLFSLLANPEHRKRAGEFSVFTGNDKDFLTTRISYKLNLKGPSVAVQTACSTSLVAITMASDSLLAHQCDMALAGGVAIRIPQRAGCVYQEGQIFSRDGHTRSFDAEASGTLFTNGVGLVVLKRLEDAIADRDCIRAVIKGAAINNDGALKVGYAAPSLDAQAEVIAMAHALAGIDPRTIGYVEAHGTATPMGDSIEIAALTKAFRASTNENQFCAVGSVKSNVGHLDTASGVAALIKTVLSLQHQAIPPTIHFTRPNPSIDFAASPFYVNTQLKPWLSDGSRRRAGVHSFGIGGTNAHVVLEEAPTVETQAPPRNHHLLLLSARSKSALQAGISGFISYLQEHRDVDIADVAYTMQVGRREFAQRRFFVCKDCENFIDALQEAAASGTPAANRIAHDRAAAFLFRGHGAEYSNVGQELYNSEPTFRMHIDNCSRLLRSHLKIEIKDLLYANSTKIEEANQDSIPPDLEELASFVIDYALAQLWREWGIRPEAMGGYGVGECVAACIGDVFSLPDALWLLAERRLVRRSRKTQAEFMALVSRIELRAPKIPLVSGITGTWIIAEAAKDPAYWCDQFLHSENQGKDLSCLLQTSNRILIEIGPTSDAADSMLNTLGQLWSGGMKIDWSGFWRHEKRNHVPLPGYAFDRKRYWVDATPPTTTDVAPIQAFETPQVACGQQEYANVEKKADQSDSGDEVELAVAEIWQRLLGLEQVGIYDNFFALGGHSMLGAQLLAALRATFRVEIPLPSLFEVPTVAGMAERIRALR